MIKYNLKCENNHEFESWFSDSGEFERLRKKNYWGHLCPSRILKINNGSNDFCTECVRQKL